MTTCISISCLPTAPSALEAIDYCKKHPDIGCIYFLGEGALHASPTQNPQFKIWQEILTQNNIDALCCINSMQVTTQEPAQIKRPSGSPTNHFKPAGIGLLIEALIASNRIISFNSQTTKKDIIKQHKLSYPDIDHSYCVQINDIHNSSNTIAAFNTALMLKVFERSVDIHLHAPQLSEQHNTINLWLQEHHNTLEQLISLGITTIYADTNVLPALNVSRHTLTLKFRRIGHKHAEALHLAPRSSLKTISI